MYPQHALSHRDHENSLYHMIQQHKPIAHVLEYDDFVRKHYIEKIGEPWMSTDPTFTHMTSLLLTTNKFENDKHQKKHGHNHDHGHGHQNHPQQHSMNRSNKPHIKSKPKVSDSAGVCFTFNGMSKNVATCSRQNCPYPHKCTNCKGGIRKPNLTNLNNFPSS